MTSTFKTAYRFARIEAKNTDIDFDLDLTFPPLFSIGMQCLAAREQQYELPLNERLESFIIGKELAKPVTPRPVLRFDVSICYDEYELLDLDFE